MKRHYSPKKSPEKKVRSRSRTPSSPPPAPPAPSDFIPLSIRPLNPPSKDLPPWIRPNTMSFADANLQLHEEILDFFDFMQPSSSDLSSREEVISRMKKIAKDLWENSEVSVFGSFETGLWLPNSDLDLLVLTGTNEKPEDLINNFAFSICKLGMASEMDRILSATVPILKMKDKKTGIYLDICFNIENGLQGVGVVKEYLAKYPQAKYLVCVVKYFLKQRGLNDTYSGGIGSFLLFCMVISSIQQHPALRAERKNYARFTLGHYLMYFLKLFGEELNYETTGISIRGEGAFFKKSSKNWTYFDRENFLAVECPQNQENDLGKSSYSIELVKKAFSHAYKILCSQNKRIAKTPLSMVVRIDELILSRIQTND